MKRDFSIGALCLSMASFLVACQTAGNNSSVNADSTKSKPISRPDSRMEVYYSFEGPFTVDLSKDSDCGGGTTPEMEACQTVGGKIYQPVPECKTFCSVPIAKPGFVSGHDFKGYLQAEARPKGQSCKSDGANSLAGMCKADGGRVSFDAHCNALCSKPVKSNSKKEMYYSFEGPFTVDLSKDSDCGGDTNSEMEACQKVWGKIYQPVPECKTFCSIPIAKPGSVSGHDFSGYRMTEALPKDKSCPSGGINPLAGMCKAGGGRVSFDKACNALCSQPVKKP